MYISLSLYIYIYKHAYTYIYMMYNMYNDIYIYIYICIALPLSLYIYIYIHTHTYIHIMRHMYNACTPTSAGLRTVGPEEGDTRGPEDMAGVDMALASFVRLRQILRVLCYTRSPLEDSRLFGPSPWKILRHYLRTNGFLSNPASGENLLSGNLVMETGCTASSVRVCQNRHLRVAREWLEGNLKSVQGYR